MSVQYHLVQRGNSAKPDEPKKFYATAQSKGDITLRELSREIAEISTVSVVDTTAVIESLLQIIPRHVTNGNIVRLADFGSFNIRIDSEPSDTEEAFNKSLINGVKLYFRPGKELQKALENVEFEKE